MANNRNIQVAITGELTGLRGALNKATSEVKGFGTQLKSSMTTFGGQAFTGLTTSITALGAAAAAAAIGGLYTFSRYMSSAIEVSSKFQSIDRSFAAITGNSRLAGKEMAFVSAEADRLGIDLLSAADSYKQLLAASKGTTEEGKTTRAIFSAVAEAASALGMSSEATQGSLLAISQMMSKGSVQAEELRGQLGERLPGAFNIMAKSMGVSTAQLDKMLQDGEVGTNVLRGFAAELHKLYGSAAANNNTYEANVTKLGNAFTRLQLASGKLVTNNSFVLESIKLVTKSFEGFAKTVDANKTSFVSLVKDGVLLLLNGLSTTIEVMRFFYNGWQGLSLVAHGATWLMIKCLELTVKAIRSVILPFDLLLTGMEKIGAIDINPLKNWEQNLHGIGQISLDDFNALLEKVKTGNVTFDSGKEAISVFKKQIEGIPAVFIDANKKVNSANGDQMVEWMKGSDGKLRAYLKGVEITAKTSAQNQINENAKVVQAATTTAQTQIAENAKVGEAAVSTAQKQMDANAKVGEAAVATSQKVIQADSASTSQMVANAAAISQAVVQTIEIDGRARENAANKAKVLDQSVVDQIEKNISYMDARVAKGGVSQGYIDEINSLKESFAKAKEESEKAIADINKDTGTVGKKIQEIDGVWQNVNDTAKKESETSSKQQERDVSALAKAISFVGGEWKTNADQEKEASDEATKHVLENIAKVKAAQSEVRDSWTLKNNTTNSGQGMIGLARGGDPFWGGLRGYGGGDRRMILVEDGEHVIRKEAVARLGHGFFQRFNLLGGLPLPKLAGSFASGGPINQTTAAAPIYNLTLNYSGPASQSSARDMAKMVVGELQKMHRGRS